MGFFKWLFRKQKMVEEQENWEQVVYERDKVNFHDAEERKRYLSGCLEQMGEAEKEMNLLTGEYSLVTSYLTDIEEIESLPSQQMSELKGLAAKILSFEQEKRRYMDKKERMSDSEYRKMRSQENEIEEGIRKLKDAEHYQKLVKQDMSRLDGERHAYEFRKVELTNMLVNLRGMAFISLAALAACIVMLLILQFGFTLDTSIGYYLAVASAAVAITILFIKFVDAQKELSRVGKAENRLIHLQNTVKIRYVNNVNLLDYLYIKYGVEHAGKLEKLWNIYQGEKDERRQYAEAESKLDFYKEQLMELLSSYRVKDPGRFVQQPAAIVDAREMIELRHGLIIRRQSLRKQLDYNQKLAESAGQEIKDIAYRYPQYASEISDIVDRYARDYG
ncbi:MAG TPA: hypothetical protein VJY54_10140 [Lachnospiraceae bacterium]|nr:hypothetical protein [Lachnospiraceae bacterium]